MLTQARVPGAGQTAPCLLVRGDRKYSGQQGLFLVGSAVAPVAGRSSACWLSHIRPVCVFSRCWKPENYISQTPVRSCQWEEPMRDGKARGRKKKGLYLLLRLTSERWAPAPGLGPFTAWGGGGAQVPWLLLSGSCASCSTPVWACGFQPRDGSRCPASEHHLLPPKACVTSSWY